VDRVITDRVADLCAAYDDRELAEMYLAFRDAVVAHLADPLLDGWTRAHLEEALKARDIDPSTLTSG
jgi:hypothetical protein